MLAPSRKLRTANPISKPIVRGLLRAFDVLAIVGAGLVAFHIWPLDEWSPSLTSYAWVAALGALLGVNLFQVNDIYRFSTLEKLRESLARTALSWTTAAAVLICLSFFTKTSTEFSRGWAIIWFFTALAALGGMRIFAFYRIRHWRSTGRLSANVAIVGTAALAQRVMTRLEATHESGARVVGLYGDSPETRHGARLEHPLIGNLDALIRDARLFPIDTIIVALPWTAEARVRALLDRLCELPVDVKLGPDGIGFQLGRCSVSHYGSLTTLNVQKKPLVDWQYVIKEVEDRVLAALALIFILPVMAAITIAIKLDSPGPALFKQKRYGFNDRLIDVFKFRTMYHNLTDQNADQLTQRNDPRVTRVGAFLRRTSLDELPQLFNVLRGDMSIVGPRPHALRAKAAGILYPEAVRHYSARHRVKPGITGWAQVNGWRGETETLEQIAKRVEHDLYYIENWSVLLDMKIILRTVMGGFTGRYAY